MYHSGSIFRNIYGVITYMKIKTIAFSILILFISNCTTKDNLCEAVLCDAPSAYLRIRYIDGDTNRDLLFSENPAYQLSDLKIRSSTYGGTLPFKIDSSEKDHRYISILSQGNETITLKLGNRNADEISIESQVVKQDCCGSLEITRLMLNQDVVCRNCVPLQTIVIKK